MTNQECHEELSRLLGQYVKAKETAPTKKQKERYSLPIDALRQACKTLRQMVEKTDSDQTNLF